MRNHLITQLHGTYFSVLYNYALKLTFDETKAADLVSEVFVKICKLSDEKLDDLIQYQWEFEEELVERDRTLGYLMVTLKNTLTDQYRKKSSRNKNETSYSNGYKNTNGLTPEDICISNDEIQKILDAMDDVFLEASEEKKMSFVLKYQGFKSKEIAKRLSIPENTVNTNVRRMRIELRRKISLAR